MNKVISSIQLYARNNFIVFTAIKDDFQFLSEKNAIPISGEPLAENY
jgi:hypothetical protein